VMKRPTDYGIQDTEHECAGRALFHQNATPCANPETHYYYHGGHPSTAVHRIVGGKMAEEIGVGGQ
jgi:phospholipase/lecithinase/hemolysin